MENLKENFLNVAFSKFLNNIEVTFNIIIKHLKTVDDYVVKSDEESIEKLLKTDEDKAKFRNEIDNLIKNNTKTKNIRINNKNITISI